MSLGLLVADDEDTIRKGVAKYIKLHTDRFEKIYEAEDGQEAIDIALKFLPEVILLDVQMPLKNGIDVMREIDKSDYNPIIIILSGYDDFKYAQQAIKYGAAEYLLKPIRATDILDCVNRLVNNKYGEEEKEVFDADDEQQNHIVKAAQDYIAEHYAENISLAYVANKLGITNGYLSTLFMQHLNCGYVDYLNSVRIERSCSYLAQDYLKIYEVAYKVGYKDEKYYTKVFKKIKGMTPRAYREMNR